MSGILQPWAGEEPNEPEGGHLLASPSFDDFGDAVERLARLGPFDEGDARATIRTEALERLAARVEAMIGQDPNSDDRDQVWEDVAGALREAMAHGTHVTVAFG